MTAKKNDSGSGEFSYLRRKTAFTAPVVRAAQRLSTVFHRSLAADPIGVDASPRAWQYAQEFYADLTEEARDAVRLLHVPHAHIFSGLMNHIVSLCFAGAERKGASAAPPLFGSDVNVSAMFTQWYRESVVNTEYIRLQLRALSPEVAAYHLVSQSSRSSGKELEAQGETMEVMLFLTEAVLRLFLSGCFPLAAEVFDHLLRCFRAAGKREADEGPRDTSSPLLSSLLSAEVESCLADVKRLLWEASPSYSDGDSDDNNTLRQHFVSPAQHAEWQEHANQIVYVAKRVLSDTVSGERSVSRHHKQQEKERSDDDPDNSSDVLALFQQFVLMTLDLVLMASGDGALIESTCLSTALNTSGGVGPLTFLGAALSIQLPFASARDIHGLLSDAVTDAQWGLRADFEQLPTADADEEDDLLKATVGSVAWCCGLLLRLLQCNSTTDVISALHDSVCNREDLWVFDSSSGKGSRSHSLQKRDDDDEDDEEDDEEDDIDEYVFRSRFLWVALAMHWCHTLTCHMAAPLALAGSSAAATDDDEDESTGIVKAVPPTVWRDNYELCYTYLRLLTRADEEPSESEELTDKARWLTMRLRYAVATPLYNPQWIYDDLRQYLASPANVASLVMTPGGGYSQTQPTLQLQGSFWCLSGLLNGAECSPSPTASTTTVHTAAASAAAQLAPPHTFPAQQQQRSLSSWSWSPGGALQSRHRRLLMLSAMAYPDRNGDEDDEQRIPSTSRRLGFEEAVKAWVRLSADVRRESMNCLVRRMMDYLLLEDDKGVGTPSGVLVATVVAGWYHSSSESTTFHAQQQQQQQPSGMGGDGSAMLWSRRKSIACQALWDRLSRDLATPDLIGSTTAPSTTRFADLLMVGSAVQSRTIPAVFPHHLLCCGLHAVRDAASQYQSLILDHGEEEQTMKHNEEPSPSDPLQRAAGGVAVGHAVWQFFQILSSSSLLDTTTEYGSAPPTIHVSTWLELLSGWCDAMDRTQQLLLTLQEAAAASPLYGSPEDAHRSSSMAKLLAMLQPATPTLRRSLYGSTEEEHLKTILSAWRAQCAVWLPMLHEALYQSGVLHVSPQAPSERSPFRHLEEADAWTREREGMIQAEEISRKLRRLTEAGV